MEFGPSKAQAMLRQSTADLLAQYSSLDRVRQIMETGDACDAKLQAALADQGVLGLLIAEEYGGSGLGMFEMSLVAQELGRHVAPFDLASSAVVAPLLINEGGSKEQRQHWLPKIASGDEILTVARGVSVEDGELHGVAEFVPGVAPATTILVEVGGRCFLVPKNALGVSVEHLLTIDETRRWSEVTFEGVAIDQGRELAERVSAEQLMRAAEAGQLVIAADSLGACYRAIAISVEYAKGREQFGRVIGSFQAVKHLCAEMIAAVDPMQSLLWYAAYLWDQQDGDAHHVVPLCKAHSAEIGYDCVTKATQVFGGVGFTWDCDMHLFFKRVQVDRQLFGRPEQQREQAAVAQFG